MSNKQTDIWEENLQELRQDAENQKSLAEIKIIQNWYLKRLISYKEYLRLTSLAF